MVIPQQTKLTARRSHNTGTRQDLYHANQLRKLSPAYAPFSIRETTHTVRYLATGNGAGSEESLWDLDHIPWQNKCILLRKLRFPLGVFGARYQ